MGGAHFWVHIFLMSHEKGLSILLTSVRNVGYFNIVEAHTDPAPEPVEGSESEASRHHSRRP
jgi:hypothetical protein